MMLGVLDALKWDMRDPHLPWLRVGVTRFSSGDSYRPHGHDFAEWCWLESGTLLHVRDGMRETLSAGDMRFLRPGHEHAWSAGPQAGILVTASVPAALFADFERRYGALPAWPWPPDRIGMATLDDRSRATLARWLQDVPGRGQDVSDAEWLVVSTLRLLRQKQAPGTVPDWLAKAVDAMREPRSLVGGLPALVAASGHSPAHVSRVVRRAYGCTTTELVHRLRCEYAARELRMGTRPIVRIAVDAGYNHLGHFYRRFAQQFGCTPRRYRFAAVNPDSP